VRLGHPGVHALPGIALATLVIAVVTIRVRREDMAGAAMAAPVEPAGAGPALEQAHS
jgi:hypothetical protein